MAETTLYDQFGQPLRRRTLGREEAAPTVTGVRRIFEDSLASGLTPARIARVLRAANENDTTDFLTLAEEMEERDLHYAAVLGTRKRALSGITPKVIAASDAAADQAIADEVRALVEAPAFVDMVEDCLDALGKGFAVVEILWDTSERQWRPASYVWRDQRHFVFDRETRRRVLLRTEAAPTEGEPLPAFKFITHVPRLKSGLPIRGGLARLALWAFTLKAFSLRDWATFLEIYGMPFRVGKYGPGASEADKAVLLRAVRDIGSDAAAIIPESMAVEFVAAEATGDAVFEKMARFLDEQVSKGVLGQTTTTDAIAGGHAVSKEHNEVRLDILGADARQMAATVNACLIRPYIDLNHGPQAAYPSVRFPVVEPEDIAALSSVLSALVPVGLDVEMSEVRDRLGFADPDPGAVLLGRRIAGEAGALSVAETPPAPAARQGSDHGLNHLRGCPCCGAPALNAFQASGDETDALIADGIADWERQLGPLVRPVLDLAERATSYDEFLAGLAGLAAQQDARPLAAALLVQILKARGLGEAG
ncbi:DUF935 domain-containing protein [Blastochloris tepida]|uniref:DUF935 domain-containing protein n=1 Tax=Blastochloris tepida TaxID=2233851 RepID=A0A348FYI6_9HYPH|nr:DUF935 domain-containing protein [Blastochloris tepida]BBF92369.1 hypothetical protein BLTE_10540 [Blastochloris tepida]